METAARKKLLILITKSNFGGAQRYVFDLARSLKGRYDVTVALGGDGMLKAKLEEAGIRVVSIPYLAKSVNPLKDALVFFWLWKTLKRDRPDIVHVNSSKIGGAGAFVARMIGIDKVVFTAHAWAFNEDRSAIAKGLIAFLHWLTVMLSHKTIAVSGAVKRQISHLPFMDSKIEVVHLGLEPVEAFSRKDARKLLEIKEKEFAIGTIAELHPIKGLNYALESLSTAPFDFSYTIIGEGDARKSLEKTIAAAPKLAGRVRLAGFLPDAPKLLPAFDIFLLPSLSEAFGYVLLEAGHARLPVIASSVGGIPEIIEDMKSGILIHPKNPKEIERAIAHLYEDEVTRDNLAFTLMNKVKKEFSLQKMVEGTVAVYETAK
ncbi:MAG: glycosyltransferase [Candidatus Taylorbacteria bacterium]|nr:glycosyltransferase [Candidatus Taylorbacteria bacterium]